MVTAQHPHERDARAIKPRSPAPHSRYSAWFNLDPTGTGTTDIRLPGDDRRLARNLVVRPALAVLFRIAVGPSADRYVRRFLDFERAGRARPGWHWPSLLFPGVWAFYRKLWLLGLVFALLPVAGAIAFFWLEPRFERADSVWVVCAVLAVWILPGVLPALLADTLLYNHVRSLVARAERGARGATDAVQRLSQRAPTSAAAASILGGGAFIAMAAVVVPPLHDAYVEHGVRAEVEQAIGAMHGLEEEIEVAWHTARLLPRQSEHPAVRAHAGAQFVGDVDVQPRTGRIRLALLADSPEVDGKTILLAPTLDTSNHWQWMCVPVDIPKRFLPKECGGSLP
ncbi:MAG TPA: DUF2628 domain-containing protein [Casimicrobiaceae bacterium]|nr:DUF2628 domain-containing protein [Casimicrobiaceae bacterium]